MSSEKSEQEELNSTVIENIGEIIGVKVAKEEEIKKSKGKEAFVTPERTFKERVGRKAESTGGVSRFRKVRSQSDIRIYGKTLYKAEGEKKEEREEEEENKKRKKSESPEEKKEPKKMKKKVETEEEKRRKIDLEKEEDLEKCSKEDLIKCLAKEIKENRKEREEFREERQKEREKLKKELEDIQSSIKLMRAEEVYLRSQVEKIMERRKEDDKKLKKLENRFEVLENEKENNLKEWKNIERKIEKLEKEVIEDGQRNEEGIKTAVKDKLEMNDESWTEIVKKSIKEVVGEKVDNRKDEEREALRIKNNRIITGYKKRGEVNKGEIEEFFMEKLKIKVEVKAVWWIYVNNVKAVGAKMKSWEDKKKVMENKSKLKSVDSKIFIDNNTTIIEKNVRRILVAKVKEMRRA